jgi:hypothetical protein
MSRTAIPFLVVLVLLATLVVLHALRPAPPEPSRLERTFAEDDESPISRAAKPLPPPRGPEWPDLEPEEQPSDTGAPEPDEALGLVAPASETKRLVGTIVAVDPDGVEHSSESGRFRLEVIQGPEWSSLDIEVHAGRFSVDLASDARFRIDSVVLGGRPAFAERRRETFAFPGSGVLELFVRWPPWAVLHVRSAIDQRELNSIELLAGTELLEDLPHPGDGGERQVLARDASSPIDLEAILAAEEADRGHVWPFWIFYARSSGFAWGRIKIRRSMGGEGVLLLEPAGELEVLVHGEPNLAGTALRVFRTEGKCATEPYLDQRMRESRRVLLESLEAGRYRVELQLGQWWEEPIILASEHADVVAGARRSVTLVASERPQIRKVPLSGTIRVPTAWNVEQAFGSAELLGTAEDGSGGFLRFNGTNRRPIGSDEVYDWSIEGGVQPGKYALSLHDPPFIVVAEVGEEGRTDADIIVPPPGRVSVRVVDDATGVDAAIGEIHWYPAWPPGVSGGSLELVGRNETTKRFEFLAPQTEIVVTVSEPGMEQVGETIHVKAGQNEAVLRLRPACGILIRLIDGETGASVPCPRFIRPKPIDGDGSPTRFGGRRDGYFIGVSQPGRYRFAVPRVDGYEPVPDQEVLVEAGKITEHVIRLVRGR